MKFEDIRFVRNGSNIQNYSLGFHSIVGHCISFTRFPIVDVVRSQGQSTKAVKYGRQILS